MEAVRFHRTGARASDQPRRCYRTTVSLRRRCRRDSKTAFGPGQAGCLPEAQSVDQHHWPQGVQRSRLCSCSGTCLAIGQSCLREPHVQSRGAGWDRKADWPPSHKWPGRCLRDDGLVARTFRRPGQGRRTRRLSVLDRATGKPSIARHCLCRGARRRGPGRFGSNGEASDPGSALGSEDSLGPRPQCPSE